MIDDAVGTDVSKVLDVEIIDSDFDVDIEVVEALLLFQESADQTNLIRNAVAICVPGKGILAVDGVLILVLTKELSVSCFWALRSLQLPERSYPLRRNSI